MFVVKRNGNKEVVAFDKITKRISTLILEDEKNLLDSVVIAQKVITSIYSGITTEELDLESAKICSNMVTTNPLYSELAGRILVSNLHKKSSNSFVETMNRIQTDTNLLDPVWLEWINKQQTELDGMIDYTRDYLFDYFGFKTLERSYFIKNERPQHLFMRVASFINMGDIDKIKQTYNLLSSKSYTHATPTLYNAATKRPQLSSCFLLNTNDSLEGITKTWNDVAQISKWAGGIGLHISNIRAKGSLVRGTNGESMGIVPMLRVYNNIARYINQGGKRKGSYAIYLEPHHADIFEFLELKKNNGAETERARDLFLALWVSDLFMEQVDTDGDWYLMCPDQCPGLPDVYGDDYKQLYNKYVVEGKFQKKVPARKLMQKIMESQLETGTPYMLYKDRINNLSNQKNIDVIKSSNLCAEIVQVSNNEEHAVCNLASICINNNLMKFKSEKQWTIHTKTDCNYCEWTKNYFEANKFQYIVVENNENDKVKNCDDDGVCVYEKKSYPIIYYGDTKIGGFNDMIQFTAADFNFDELWTTAYTATRNLNTIIDINYYPTPETKCSNIRNRPIGLGIQGLADTLVQMRIPFDSEQSIKFNSMIMETIYHAALTASNDCARERTDMMEQFIKYILSRTDLIPFGMLPSLNINAASHIIPEYYDKTFVLDGKYNDIYHKLKINRCELKLTSHFGAYSSYIDSPIYCGKLQFDMWKIPAIFQDWDTLRENIKVYGVRNSLLTALMPTASTSQIMGNNECFEWFTSNIYTRRTSAGDFPLVCRYMVNDLISIGVWNDKIKQMIIGANGSIANLKNIPTIFRDLYKTIWEIKQIWVLQNARARAPFVDQTQSMNIFMTVPDYQKLYSCHMWGWKNGLKTGMYYLRTNAAEDAVKVTVDPHLNKDTNMDVCDSCTA